MDKALHTAQTLLRFSALMGKSSVSKQQSLEKRLKQHSEGVIVERADLAIKRLFSRLGKTRLEYDLSIKQAAAEMRELAKELIAHYKLDLTMSAYDFNADDYATVYKKAGEWLITESPRNAGKLLAHEGRYCPVIAQASHYQGNLNLAYDFVMGMYAFVVLTTPYFMTKEVKAVVDFYGYEALLTTGYPLDLLVHDNIAFSKANKNGDLPSKYLFKKDYPSSMVVHPGDSLATTGFYECELNLATLEVMAYSKAA